MSPLATPRSRPRRGGWLPTDSQFAQSEPQRVGRMRKSFRDHMPEKKLHPLVEYELGWLGDDDPAEVMEATPHKLRELIGGFDDDSLRRRPAADSCSTIELLGHFADIELIHAERFR